MKRGWLIAGAVGLFLIALGITVYPLVSNIYNEKHKSEIHTAYVEQVAEADNSQLELALEQARAYNQSIKPGTAELDAYSRESLLAASADYDTQLDLMGNGIMAYVDIPILGVYLPVFHGTSGDSLERGVGHLLGSSLPVGGTSTHAILTGHSGLATEKMFTDLERLNQGDVFYIHVLNETLAYQVEKMYTVLPHDTTYLGVVSGEDLCTLVTCTPVGVNSHRLLVRGSRIPYEEAEEIVEEIQPEEMPESKWEEQYIGGIWVGIGIVLVLVVILGIGCLFRGKSHD